MLGCSLLSKSDSLGRCLVRYVCLGGDLHACSALIGAIDEAADGQVDLDAVRAEPLKPVVH